MTQWRSGLTLRFAKPPFAGSTPACVSSNRRFTEVTLTQEQVNCFTCAGSRSAQRYLFSKTNRERRPARNFFDEKSLLVGDSLLVWIICPGDEMVDIRHLKCLAHCACGFESRPGHMDSKARHSCRVLLFTMIQEGSNRGPAACDE